MRFFSFGRAKSASAAIAAQFEAVRPFANGIAVVQKDGLWGIIDRSGAWKLEPQFTELDETGPDFVATSADGTKRVIHWDAGTQAVSGEPFRDEERRCDTSVGAQFIRLSGNLIGVTDQDHREVIPSRFDTIHYLGDDLYVCAERGKGDHLIHASGRTLFHEALGQILPEISFG